MTYQVRPLTQTELDRFNVTGEEIAKIREIMGDDAYRVTAPDVHQIRGLRGQDRALAGLSIGVNTAECSETSLRGNVRLDRDGKTSPIRRGFKIPAPPAEVTP